MTPLSRSLVAILTLIPDLKLSTLKEIGHTWPKLSLPTSYLSKAQLWKIWKHSSLSSDSRFHTRAKNILKLLPTSSYSYLPFLERRGDMTHQGLSYWCGKWITTTTQWKGTNQRRVKNSHWRPQWPLRQRPNNSHQVNASWVQNWTKIKNWSLHLVTIFQSSYRLYFRVSSLFNFKSISEFEVQNLKILKIF
jgi:hypothetical protein